MILKKGFGKIIQFFLRKIIHIKCANEIRNWLIMFLLLVCYPLGVLNEVYRTLALLSGVNVRKAVHFMWVLGVERNSWSLMGWTDLC